MGVFGRGSQDGLVSTLPVPESGCFWRQCFPSLSHVLKTEGEGTGELARVLEIFFLALSLHYLGRLSKPIGW